VLGAIIELGNCLNLLESNGSGFLRDAYRVLEEACIGNGKQMPVNKGANRQLDCDVINCIHEINQYEGNPPLDSVRCAFVEGKPIYPGSTFTDRLHIEICVLKIELIKGYFLPQPIEKYNPYLKTNFKL
jgi:hypothetical protein